VEQSLTGVLVGGTMFYASTSVGQTLQALIGINTARPPLGMISSFFTLVGGNLFLFGIFYLHNIYLVSGLLLSLECSEYFSGTKTRFKQTIVSKIDKMKANHNQTTVSGLVLGDVSHKDHPVVNVLKDGAREVEISLERHTTSIAISIIGVILFHGLGGRSMSLVPSNVRNLGAFARTKVFLFLRLSPYNSMIIQQ
jgi:hypothetical protein